ncbi:hypothetical protein ISS30_06050 [bacterium]|nr:hypothetical protein [FCB group bacterium]MBL7191240.1 hypothetical protein [bacterium]
MEMNAVPQDARAFSVDPSKLSSIGDANFLEIQKNFGAGFKELEALRANANKITSTEVDVRA